MALAQLSPDKYQLKQYLDEQVLLYNQAAFIAHDPISLPHQFSKKQDREIIGFWVAILAWGNRKSIITSGERLIQLMEGNPYDFVCQHKEEDRKKFEKFVHRTFNFSDALFFLEFLQKWYSNHDSLEDAFFAGITDASEHVGPALIHFHGCFSETSQAPTRTMKHIASPKSKSRCKRLLMFLRWMVRHDNAGVDFGIWKKIKPHQLLMPLDVHVERTARALGLLRRKALDWEAVLELSRACSELDPTDPVKYDYALFGISQSKSHFSPFLKLRKNS